MSDLATVTTDLLLLLALFSGLYGALALFALAMERRERAGRRRHRGLYLHYRPLRRRGEDLPS